jgi:hypothetical protein
MNHFVVLQGHIHAEVGNESHALPTYTAGWRVFAAFFAQYNHGGINGYTGKKRNRKSRGTRNEITSRVAPDNSQVGLICKYDVVSMPSDQNTTFGGLKSLGELLCHCSLASIHVQVVSLLPGCILPCNFNSQSLEHKGVAPKASA